jgi:hypothetical protein
VVPTGHCLHCVSPGLSANFPPLHGFGAAVTVVLLPPAHAKPLGHSRHATSSRLTNLPGLQGPTARAAQSSHWSGTQVMPQPNLARMQRLAVPMQGRRSLPFAQRGSRRRQAALQPPQYLCAGSNSTAVEHYIGWYALLELHLRGVWAASLLRWQLYSGMQQACTHQLHMELCSAAARPPMLMHISSISRCSAV